MKTQFLALAMLLSVAVRGNEVVLRIVDENSNPIPEASVSMDFAMADPSRSTERKGLTDRLGIFRGQGQAQHGVFIVCSKAGHYGARTKVTASDQDKSLTLTMPTVRNPVALHALRLSIALPVQNEWLDYDFALGDWVKPHGKGEVADVRFKFRNKFIGWKSDDASIAESRAHHNNRNISEDRFREHYGKFDGELEISFPGKQEGLVEVKDRFWAQSQLKMPHEAPVDGYQPITHYTAKSYNYSWPRDDVGFFLRTRVKLDGKGKIISANYAKIVGDFGFFPTGRLSFTYYFNPNPNDRNLEFDPQKNLFPATVREANVGDH